MTVIQFPKKTGQAGATPDRPMDVPEEIIYAEADAEAAALVRKMRWRFIALTLAAYAASFWAGGFIWYTACGLAIYFAIFALFTRRILAWVR